MQIKNEKSCARSMSDEDLVRVVRPGLTAVGPFMFQFVKFVVCMYNF